MAANTSGYLLGAGTTISLSTAGASFDGASGAAGTIMAHIISADIPDKSIQMIEQSILSSATAVKGPVQRMVPGAHVYGAFKFKIQWVSDGLSNLSTFQGDPTSATAWKAPLLQAIVTLPKGSATTGEIWDFDGYMSRVSIGTITNTGMITADIEITLSGTNTLGTGSGILITQSA